VKAVEALGYLAHNNDANRIAIAQEGGIAPLVALVRDGTGWQKQKAAYALGRLADGNDANRIAIAQEGGIALVIVLVKNEVEYPNTRAASTPGGAAKENESGHTQILEGMVPLNEFAYRERDFSGGDSC
ncbi:hypothetical protein BBJ28_00023213, partial [Nothophytophthora sp. Chile5]